MTKFALALATLLIVGIGVMFWMQSGDPVAEADALLSEGKFAPANKILNTYLKGNPDDTHALELLSESMQMDPNFDGIRGAEKIIKVLDRIPDGAKESLLARLQQSELSLMVLHEAQRAEDYARRALAIAPRDRRAPGLLCMIYQLTYRFPATEDLYNLTYNHSPDNTRLDVLKSWYVSQFDPFGMNMTYDEEQLGLEPSNDSELRRFSGFMRLEPTGPAPRAAIAAIYLDGGVAREAVEQLTDKQVDRSRADAFYYYQLIRGLVMLGELDQAEQEFASWRFTKDSHLYHRAAGLLAEENEADYDKALGHYAEAANYWPGPVDLLFHNRVISCAKKAKKPEEVTRLEAEFSKVSAGAIDPETNVRMMSALRALPHPEAIKEFAKFYKGLGREEDSQRWLSLLETKVEEPATVTPTTPAETDF